MDTAAKLTTETVEIKNRFTGAVIFTAQVEIGLSESLKLGAAVRIAVKAGANLAGAYLTRAYLTRANLTRANLADANLAGANLAGAKDLLDAGTPHGWRVVVNVFGGAVRIWAGCRSFTLSEARAHWKSRDDRKLMPALLDYIEAAAKVLGWKTEA